MENNRVIALLSGQTWSAADVDPTGRVLAVGDESGTGQLVEIAPDGGRTALTALPGRCSGRYVPGRRAVLVSHDTDGDEREQISLLELEDATLPATADQLVPLVHDTRFIHSLKDVDTTSFTYATNRRNGVDFDVVVRDLATGEETVVYDLGGWVFDVVASHDRTRAAVTSLTLLPSSTKVELVTEGATTALTDPDVPGSYGGVAFSADDDALVISGTPHERDRDAVFRVSLDGTCWEVLVEADDHDVDAHLSKAGDAMLVHHRADGGSRLALHDADGTFLRDVELPAQARLLGAVWSVDGSHLALTWSTPTKPWQLASVDAATGEVTSVLDAGDSLPDDVRRRLVAPELHRIPARDGEQIPAFVYRAPADQRVDATVVVVHGGPEGESTLSFMASIQAMLASGLDVVVPNVRGSDGYGRRWLALDDVRLRLESVADLVDLHAWLPTVGLSNDRAALWGGSYGGYMVLAGLTMQPQLWAAGVDIVGMSSLVTFLENTSPYRRAFREREYGSLEQDRQFLEQASPLTHLDALAAPLFIIHGANDPRVPLSEAEQIAARLAEKGLRHELMVFADEGHGLVRRENRLQAYPAALDFLVEVLTDGKG